MKTSPRSYNVTVLDGPGQIGPQMVVAKSRIGAVTEAFPVLHLQVWFYDRRGNLTIYKHRNKKDFFVYVEKIR